MKQAILAPVSSFPIRNLGQLPMFRITRDLILCAVIDYLTLAVPVIGYVVSGDTLLQQGEDAVLRA